MSAIDKIRSDFDSAALKLKRDIEEAILHETGAGNLEEEQKDNDLQEALSVSVPNLEDEIVSDPDEEETVLYSDNELAHSVLEEEKSNDDDTDDDDDDDYEEEDEEEEEEEEGEEGLPTAMASGDDDDDLMEVSIQDTEHTVVEKRVSILVSKKSNSYTMCWDNVGKKVITRHPTENKTNKYMNMALGYIAVNRVPSMHLSWKDDDTVVKAVDIQLDKYLPAPSDVHMLRYRMEVLVGRILVRHLTWFHDNLSECSTSHILHEYSLESTRKSVLINFGVFNEDPCSTQGAIGIYERLQKYVPTIDNCPIKTLVFGDGLSCERGNDAQRARSNGLDPFERLEGLEPAAKEFHKEMLLLQDFYDEFFKGSSASNRGTLPA